MKKVFLITALVLSMMGGFAQDNTTDEGVVINGVKWATRNVDNPGTFADTPESPGKFYQWNKKNAWAATGDVFGWKNSKIKGDNWTKDNDPSPKGWRVPTRQEIESLLYFPKVDKVWDETRKGYIFTDKESGQSIFLPAISYRYLSDGTLGNNVENYAYYWSSTPNASSYAYYMDCSDQAPGRRRYYDRAYGLPVRPVAE